MTSVEQVRLELLAALDDHDIPRIQDALVAYADSVQKVKLQISARELLARLYAGDVDPSLFEQVRQIAMERRHSSTRVQLYGIFGTNNVHMFKQIAQRKSLKIICVWEMLSDAIKRFWMDSNFALDDTISLFAKAARHHSPEGLVKMALRLSENKSVLITGLSTMAELEAIKSMGGVSVLCGINSAGEKAQFDWIVDESVSSETELWRIFDTA